MLPAFHPIGSSAVRVVAFLVIAANAAPLVAQQRGVPAEDCCLVHLSTGCDQLPVVSCVCGQDPFCCDTEWDAVCVDEAINLCGASCPLSEACCDQGTGCLQLDPTDCLNFPGTPQGPGSECQFAPCSGSGPEACCLPNGMCSFEDPFVCQKINGVPQGTGSDCEIAVCQEAEACCFGATGCLVVTPDFCISTLEGLPQGPGTTCTPSVCTPQPPEACCFSGGSCAEIGPGQCISQNGTPQGPATTCGFEACTGGGSIQACCDPNSASCFETTVDECVIFVEGFPQGPGTNCSIVTCPTLTGACCLPNGTCVESTFGDCVQSNGFPFPLGSTCQGIECIDCNENGVPDQVDIAGTTSTDVNTNSVPDECEPDCNGNGVPDDVDIAGATSTDVNTNGVPDECDPDCNGNGVPDDVDIAGATSNDINTNGIPDECESDCNENNVPDSWEIAQGTATDLDTNGIPDLCDILACRYSDLNYNGLPDAIEIAEGSSADANTNGIIDEAEEPAGEHSYISLMRRASNGPIFAGPDGLPLRIRVDSNGVVLDSNGFVIPDTNGWAVTHRIRDDFLAAKLKEALINTNGPNPVANIKHVKIFVQSCHGGGMLDDIARAFGNIICWVGGSAARSNETAKGEADAVPDAMGRWTRALRDALINTNGTVLQALKIASRTDAASPINRPGSRWVERPVYTTGDKEGGETIPLFDSEATSHHAIFIAGITDQKGIENEITRFCELLEDQWGDLDTNGTSVHVLFGTGTKNPCSGSGVPNANILPATIGDLCQLIVDLTTNGTFNANEELLIYGGDHGTASVDPVNSPPGRSAARGVPGLIEQQFVVSPELKYSMTRDPRNQPFIQVITSGSFAPHSVSVALNGIVYGYLDPNGVVILGQPESNILLPEGSVRVGFNDLTIDLNGQPVVVLDTEFFLGDIAPIPMPGWGDINGDTEVDLGDLPEFIDCLAGPGAGYVLPDCVYADIDEDGDVDLVDGKLLQSVFTGGIP